MEGRLVTCNRSYMLISMCLRFPKIFCLVLIMIFLVLFRLQISYVCMILSNLILLILLFDCENLLTVTFLCCIEVDHD